MQSPVLARQKNTKLIFIRRRKLPQNIYNLIYVMTSLKNQQIDGGHATEKFYIPELLKIMESH